MPRKRRTAAEQRFWDDRFRDAWLDALRRNGKRSDEARITWAAARADGALAARSQKEAQR